MIANARQEGHLNAKTLMLRGEFAQAAMTLKGTLLAHGPHVLGLIDLASCYYMIQEVSLFREKTILAYEAFEKNRAQLSQITLKRVALGLGKLLEEIGHVSEALELYENALTLHKSESEVMDEWVCKIRAQYLRLLSELSLNGDLATQYLLCEQMYFQDRDCQIDLQNALMEADFILFGQAAARARLRRFLQEPEIQDFEKKLLFFNFLYYSLRESSSQSIESFELEMFDYFTCDQFEKALWDLYLLAAQKTCLAPIELDRSEGMSFLCSLRYLFLLQQMGSQSMGISGAQEKMLFLLKTIPAPSQKLIRTQWLGHTPDSSVAITITPQGVFLDGRILNLGKSQNSIKLLELMVGQRAVSVEKLIQEIFGLGQDQYSQARLRVLVYRLNKKILDEASIPSIFEFVKPLDFSDAPHSLRWLRACCTNSLRKLLIVCSSLFSTKT
jgi:hypothetical protein